MGVIEFCRRVELYAWEEYAFEGAALICEHMIDDGIIDVDKMTIAYATRLIVRDQHIPA